MIKSGALGDLHYLERQRVIMLNALLIIVLSLSLIISTFTIFALKTVSLNLFLLPVVCIVSLYLNKKEKHIPARHIAYWGVVLSIAIWCFTTRRAGYQYLYIAIASSSIVIFRKKRLSFLAMFVCGLLYISYIFYDMKTPFLPNPYIDYENFNILLAYITAGFVFFQTMVSRDIASHVSNKLDENFNELNLVYEKQKETKEKLKETNEKLILTNKKLDIIAKNSTSELLSYQEVINDNLYCIETDKEGKITSINDIYLNKTGYSREEIIGKSIDILKSEFHDDEFYENISKTISSGNVWRGESEIKTKNVNPFWVVSSILPIKNKKNKINGFLTISADITDKKNAEYKVKQTIIELSQSEKRLKLFLENQIDLVVITTKNGDRKYVNKAFCSFFGKEKEYFIGTNYKTLDDRYFDEKYINLFDSISYNNPKISSIAVLYNASNEKRWIQWDEIAFFDENKDVLEILSIGHDITELKDNEENKANYIAQFEELAFKNSHRFRRPLSNIVGVINLINQDIFDEEVKELVGIIKTEINTLDSSSRELTNFINSNSSSKQNINVLTVDFMEAKLKHLKWKYKIKSFLEGTGSLSEKEALSHEHCEVGKWYYSEGKEKYSHIVAMQKFEKEHENLHNLVKEIYDLRSFMEMKQAELKYAELIKSSDLITMYLDEADKIINGNISV